MEAILNSVSDPRDLIDRPDSSTPYRFNRIFHSEGFGAKRLEKKRLKLMKEIDPQIQRLLVDGERVQFVSWGIDFSIVDYCFMGAWAFIVNQRALIFTDRRILIIQINSRRKMLDLKAQLRYEAIEKLGRQWGVVAVMLHNKKKLTITGVPRKDRKAIRTLIEGKIHASRTATPLMAGVENLCPRCGHRVRVFPERCKQCTQSFKSGSRAGWLSLIFPGLGGIYLGHRWLGVAELFTALLIWGAFVIPLGADVISKDGSWIELAGVAGLIFLFVHGANCWITRRVGYKGIYPAN